MNDMRTMILDTADRICRDKCDQALIDKAEAGDWPADLWTTLEEAGLTLAAVPDDKGGAGGTLGDGLALVKTAARHAAPVPLAETLLAGHLLAEAGLDVPTGPLTIAPVRQGEASDGPFAAVPFARYAAGIVVATDDGVALVDRTACTIEPGLGTGGEARDTVIVNTMPALTSLPGAADTLWHLGALARSAQMAGAVEAILEMTVQYVQDRVQFGRPLSKFQAIQQSLAVLAGQSASASMAADIAIAAAEAGDAKTEIAVTPIAVAKARVGEAASIAAEIAHQAHGAIGFTYEYRLHQFTRRLWTWRDEFGAEPVWQAALGRQVAQNGADNLWAFVTG